MLAHRAGKGFAVYTLVLLALHWISRVDSFDVAFSPSSGISSSRQYHNLRRHQYQPQSDQQCKEYITPTGRTLISASARRLLQEAPSACGKIGTLVPNYYTHQGSMYGLSLAPNADGSLIVVGAPLNVPNVTWPGGALLLTSQNSKTCEYTTRPVWKPRDSYKYYGAQVALSEDGGTMLIMDGVEAVMRPNGTNCTSACRLVPAGNKPVVHVFRQTRRHFLDPNDPSCCVDKQSACCRMAAKDLWNWKGPVDGSLPSGQKTGGSPGKSGNSAVELETHPSAGKQRRRLLSGKEEFRYVQKLDADLRQAMASAMSVSTSKDGNIILVSMSVGEGFPDKRGSAQVFYWDTRQERYKFIQDLAMLNQPAGVSVHFGAASQISSDGKVIAVATAAFSNQLNKHTYIYHMDPATERFRIIYDLNNGEAYADPWPTASGMGVNVDNGLSLSQSGKYLMRVQDNNLVVYEAMGSGLSTTWARRCQIAPPLGYLFRTNAGSLSIVEVSGGKVKFAAGAYMGDLQYNQEQMAVFLYFLDADRPGSCPWRPAEKHTHADPFSQYGAAVQLTPDGKVLIVGAPDAWDNNMTNQTGAVYLIDASKVEDTGLRAVTVTQAANDKAGCVNGKDANGNDCVKKPYEIKICKDVVKKDGTIIHFGPPGCTPTPPPSGGWFSAASLGDAEPAEIPGVFKSSSVSAYTTLSPSIKGGVAVPVGQNLWAAKQTKAAAQASYFGVPTTALTNPKESIISAAGWQPSVSAALGGIPKPEAAPPAISVANVLSGLGSALAKGLGSGSGPAAALPANIPGAAATAPIRSVASRGLPAGLPAGAVIKNPEVLRQAAG